MIPAGAARARLHTATVAGMSVCPVCGQRCLVIRVLTERGVEERELRAHAQDAHKILAWAGYSRRQA